jgi:hypothetical protein
MRDLLGRLLKTPIFEGQNDVLRDNRLLHLVLFSVLGLVILNTAGLFLIYKRKLAVSIFLFALLAIAEVCFWLMRRGRAHLMTHGAQSDQVLIRLFVQVTSWLNAVYLQACLTDRCRFQQQYLVDSIE